MKRIEIHISRKKCIWFATAIAALLLLWLINLLRVALVGGQESQNMAARWGKDGGVAQISCFFSENAGVTRDQVIGFGHQLDSMLLEESITADSANESARLWTDAYSAVGNVTLVRENKSMTVNALGVGGDFFYFHPLELQFGYYFFESDINQDYVVIDEDIAWQLFGSSDVAGMQLSIGNKPYVVSGVIHRQDDRLSKAAGLEKPLVYLSYQALCEMSGGDLPLNHYEIVMPNPVTDYAYNKVKENLGVSEETMVLVENTKRYSFLNGLKQIPKFGIRSMSEKAIIYPYWENVARAKEDINSLIVLLEVPFILYLVVFLLVNLIVWYRHKKWTVESLWKKIKDISYQLSARLRMQRSKRKEERRS